MTQTPQEPQAWTPEKLGHEVDTPALRLFDYCGKANPDAPAVLKYTVGDVLRDIHKFIQPKDALARAALAFADAKNATKAAWVNTGQIPTNLGASLDKATDNLLMAVEAYRSTAPSDA